MNEAIEHIPSGREILKGLEAEGKYLFHGSEREHLDSLEPRQAYNFEDGIQKPDGDPAVFASSKADYSILMAIVNERNCPNGYRSGAESSIGKDGVVELHLTASKASLEQLDDNSIGYVYVFDKDLFQPKGQGAEYVSKTPVTSAKKIKVMKSDLPPYIEIVE